MPKAIAKIRPKSINDNDRIMGGNVRTLRMAHDMSQEKLGEKLNLTFQQIQKYERGVNRIAASRVIQLAEIFGVAIDRLYLGTSSIPSASAEYAIDPGRMLVSTHHGMRLASAFQTLPTTLQRSVVHLIEQMAAVSKSEATHGMP